MEFIQDCLAGTSTQRMENAVAANVATVNHCNTCYLYVCWFSHLLCLIACTQLSSLSSGFASKLVGTSVVDLSCRN